MPAILHQDFQRLAPVAPAGNTLPDILDAIAAALGAATDNDGAPRRHAWTPTKEISGVTVSVRCAPEAGGSVPNMRVIFAGVTAGAPTPAMYGSHGFNTAELYGGTTKDVTGAFTSWTTAVTPFTTGFFSGFARILSTATSTVTFVHVIEGREAICVGIQMSAPSANQIMWSMYGRIGDSGSTDPLDSEEVAGDHDGRIFGMLKTPPDASFNTNENGGAVNAGWILGSLTEAGQPVCMAFDIGLGTSKLLNRMNHANNWSATLPLLPSGKVAAIPVWYAFFAASRYGFRLSNVRAIHKLPCFDVSVNAQGIAISQHTTTPQDAYLFEVEP